MKFSELRALVDEKNKLAKEIAEIRKEEQSKITIDKVVSVLKEQGVTSDLEVMKYIPKFPTEAHKPLTEAEKKYYSENAIKSVEEKLDRLNKITNDIKAQSDIFKCDYGILKNVITKKLNEYGLEFGFSFDRNSDAYCYQKYDVSLIITEEGLKKR